MPIIHVASIGATLLAGATVIFASHALAQKVVPAESEIAFATKQMGSSVKGSFKKWDAQITLDPKQPQSGKIGFTIATGSATFGSAETDAEMPKAAWFNTAIFPQASFQSSAIRKSGADTLEVAGKLQIKGMVRDVVVPVTLVQAGSLTIASGAFAIKRLDFKIGEGEWADTGMVSNDVQVKFKLALTGLGPL